MGEHERSHFPRRPRQVGGPPERKPDLAATTPRSRRRPPVVRYVPVFRKMRRKPTQPVERPPQGIEIEISWERRDFGWTFLLLYGVTIAGIGILSAPTSSTCPRFSSRGTPNGCSGPAWGSGYGSRWTRSWALTPTTTEDQSVASNPLTV